MRHNSLARPEFLHDEVRVLQFEWGNPYVLCVCVFSTLKVPGYREQSGGATGRGRVGTMARGDGRARAWGAGVHTDYIATAYLYIPGCTPVTSPYSRSVP